ncbi:MAG TPA: tetratricopeptide repeat protein, partial [Blastocatellia bacterium]|nr:tetratricopeptide repeat protein [Blastocatellia bacterium]
MLTAMCALSQAQETRKAPARAPATFDQIAKRANQAREADRLGEAIDLYQQGLRMRPNWAEGWWNLGTIFYDQDRYTEGRDAFRHVVALDPKNAAASGLLGLCEFQTREYQRSLVDLQRARLLGMPRGQQVTSVVRYHAAILMTRFEQFEVAYDILREFAAEGDESPNVIEAFGLNILR